MTVVSSTTESPTEKGSLIFLGCGLVFDVVACVTEVVEVLEEVEKVTCVEEEGTVSFW